MNSLDLTMFPFKSIRPEQERIAKKISNSYNKRYHLLDCATGIGKSPLAVMLARSEGRSIIVTDSIQLQDQYERDFYDHLLNIKGISNYECSLGCSDRPCTVDKRYYRYCLNPEKVDEICPYLVARKEAVKSNVVLVNYALLMTTLWLTEDKAGPDMGFVNQWLDDRHTIIFDEAHLLEKHLVSLCTLKVSVKELDEKYHIFKYVDDPIKKEYLTRPLSETTDRVKFFNYLIDVCRIHYEEWGKALEMEMPTNVGGTMPADLIKEVALSKEFENILFILNTYIKSKDKTTEWILSMKEEELYDKQVYIGKQKYFYLQPLKVDWIFDRFFKKRFDRFYFMSATILDADLFCKTLGIETDQMSYIQEESPFDPAKSPIIGMNCCQTSYQSLQNENNMRQIVGAVEAILQMFPNEKGIIHSGNMRISKYLQDHISSNYASRLLVRYGAKTNREIFKEHTRSRKPTVLVSSSMAEGVDLKDDLGRFQIIVKMPFLSLGDERISYLANNAADWYSCDMMKTLVQQAGRATRNENDYSYTFILDKSFSYYLNNARNKGWLTNQFCKRVITPQVFINNYREKLK